MKKLSIIVALSISTAVFAVEQDPRVQEDINAFKAHFEKTFPGKTGEEFANGPYSFNEDKLLQYDAQMDMPPF
jgi:thiamine phosphate synthase YjbQ (UPF0047 family)